MVILTGHPFEKNSILVLLKSGYIILFITVSLSLAKTSTEQLSTKM
jgi:energy-converting hydrogenase Eha subunit C